METFEATIEQKLAKMFEKMQNIQPAAVPVNPPPAVAPPCTPSSNPPIVIDCSSQQSETTNSNATPAPATTASAIPWDIIRREIQEAIRSEMSTINESTHIPKFESTPCHVQTETRIASMSTKKRTNLALQRLRDQARTATAADDSTGEAGLNSTVVVNTKTPRRFEVINVDSDEEEGSNADEEGVIVRRRRSNRLSDQRKPFGEIDANVSYQQVVNGTTKTVQIRNEDSYLWEVENGHVRRRSTRISLRKTMVHLHKKGCCQSAKKKKQRFEPLIEDEKENLEQTNVTSKRKGHPLTISNKVIAGYFHQTPGRGKKEPKMTASKHGKAVLDLVNRGSIKEVQILPTVGLKMAYQIVTHR